jgi:ribosomal protein S12 methylthiotransferase accessory factor
LPGAQLVRLSGQGRALPARPGFDWHRDPGPKSFRRGGDRSLAPAALLDRVRRFMPVMGITRLANLTGLDVIGLPVVMACRPNSRSVAVSMGKGLTLEAAKASALMEAVETYHAEQITAPLKLASFEELRYDHALADPLRLPLCRQSAYHPGRRLLWIEGCDLVSGRSCWVPYELVHTDYTLPPPSGSGCFLASSNGLAAGGHPLEAIAQALCELVERDAVTLFNRLADDQRAARRLDPDSIAAPDCREVIARCRAAGMALALFDATSDLGIATVICLLAEAAPPALLGGIAVGSGCHPDPAIALVRAITEAVQIRLAYISGARDDLPDAAYGGLAPSADAAADPRLRPAAAGGRSFDSIPGFRSDTFADDLAWMIDRLLAQNLDQVIVVELTKPATFAIPVVRLVIPGLEGIDDHPLYRPGRRARALLRARA